MDVQPVELGPVELVAHRRQRRAQLPAVTAHRHRIAQQAEAQPAGGGRQHAGGEGIAPPGQAVGGHQRPQPRRAQEARAVHVGIGLARPAALGLAGDTQRRRARLRAGHDVEAGGDAAQVVDQEDHALDIAHAQDVAGPQLRQVALDHPALHRQAVGPLQVDAVEPAFEQLDLHDAAFGHLLGQVGIAQVPARRALQKAGDVGRGVDQVFVAAAGPGVGRQQRGQCGQQFGRGVGRQAVTAHVERQLAGGFLQLTRGCGARRQVAGVGAQRRAGGQVSRARHQAAGALVGRGRLHLRRGCLRLGRGRRQATHQHHRRNLHQLPTFHRCMVSKRLS